MTVKNFFYLFLILGLGVMISCSDDENPTPDDGEEEISKVVLTFTPDNGEDAIVATWLDADGEGGNDPTIDEIELEEEVTYTLTLTLTNTLGDEDEDITAEIAEESDEHMFFFSFTEDFFADPLGDGNADSRSDALNYADTDGSGFPIGLTTTWTTGEHSETEGSFTVMLKHQPDGLKTATSDATTGGTDLNITFPIHIEEEGHEHNDDEEEINKIDLTFTPTAGGGAITATWFDSDGEGINNATVDAIDLAPNTEYEMSITLTNTLGVEDEDITAEVLMEDDEHMFFFSFTADIFSDPAGDGNIDARGDALNYNDQDENGNPVGLSTTWTTGSATTTAGDFKVLLKHQPDLKTTTSDATVGGTDLDLDFSININ